MTVLWRRVSAFAACVLLAGALAYISGYRADSFQAAVAHPAVEQPAALVGQVDTGWGAVFVLDTAGGPVTLGCSRWGFLWRCPGASIAKRDETEPVRTAGLFSWTTENGQQVTVLAVESGDPKVAFIEAGPPRDRTRQPIAPGRPVLFHWAKAMFHHDIAPMALAADGTPIYEYRTAAKPAITFPDDLKWFPVGGSQ